MRPHTGTSFTTHLCTSLLALLLLVCVVAPSTESSAFSLDSVSDFEVVEVDDSPYPPYSTDFGAFLSPPSPSLSTASSRTSGSMDSLPLSLPLLERYALTPTPAARQSLLTQQLDVNSEDYFFLQLLAWQTEDQQSLTASPPNTKAPAPHHLSSPYKSLLKAYRERFPHSSQLRAIDLRHQLLAFPSSNSSAQQQLLRLIQTDYAFASFDHSTSQAGNSPAEDGASALPTRMEPSAVDVKALLAKLNDEAEDSVSSYLSSSPLALDALARHLRAHSSLATARRRFLESLSHPGVPHLVDLIAAELKASKSTFGSVRVHSMLSAEELEALSRQYSDVQLQPSFVSAQLERMRPDGGLDGLTAEEKAAWYEAQAAFVLPLAAVHNDLKANVLYHVLAFRLSQPPRPNARLDVKLLLAFVALPLPQSHPFVVDASHRAKREGMRAVNLQFERGPLFPAVARSQHGGLPAVVAEYVQRLYREQATEKEGAQLDAQLLPFLNADGWLLRQRAIARLESVESLSAADQAQYTDWLRPEAASARDKELLTFLPSSASPATTPAFAVGDAMRLTLTLKNVGRSLRVKVYRINAAAYYKAEGREIDPAALDLSGVVAHYEETIDLPAYSPFHRFTHTLTLSDMLKDAGARGVFVCEATAKGQKVRALVRRGALSFLSVETPSGVLVQVFDVDRAVTTVQLTRVHVAGQTYEANADGNILLPFAASRQSQSLVLTATDSSGCEYSSLAQFDYPSQDFALALGVQVDPESLLAGAQCEVALRPLLTLNGHRVPLALLQRVRVQVQTVLGDGVSSSQQLKDVELKEGVDFVHSFVVPTRLRSLTVTLTGEVQVQSVNEKRELSASRRVDVSDAIAAPDVASDEEGERESLDDLYLRLGSEGYAVLVLGKAGEPIPHRPVGMQLNHRYLAQPLRLSFQTDDNGRVLLGPLPHVLSVEATTLTSGRRRTRTFQLDSAQQSVVLPSRIHSLQGETVTIAYPSAAGLLASQSFPPTGGAALELDDLFCLLQVDSADTSLVRRKVPLAKALQVQAGFIQLQGLEAGRYSLLLKSLGEAGSRIDLLIVPSTSPPLLQVFVAEPQRVVELANDRATPSLSSVTREADGSLVLQVAHPTATTRVHLSASHFVSSADPWMGESAPPLRVPLLRPVAPAGNVHLSQSQLGDEARYILQRKAAPKRVGNLLPRPTLLNNEEERRGTTFDEEPQLMADKAYAPAPPPPGGFASFAGGFGAPPPAPRAMAAMMAAPGMMKMVVNGGDRGASRPSSSHRHRKMESEAASDEDWQADRPASVDFLKEPSFRMWNAQLDERGRLSIPAAALSPHHSHLDVLVVDDGEGDSGSISRSRVPVQSLQTQPSAGEQRSAASSSPLPPHYRDLRHFPAAGPSSGAALVPVVELQRVTPLLPSTSLTIADRLTASVSVFDNLDDLFHLLHTLTADSGVSTQMDKFAFVLQWPRLSEDEKRSLYSEFACHELHLFLHQRDRPFFDAVVRPFLRQRLQPSMFDSLLLGDDASHWAEGSQWLRLNPLEQLLLARQSAAQGNASLAERIFRSLEQRAQAQPPRPLDEAATRFNTALMVHRLSGTADDIPDDDAKDGDAGAVKEEDERLDAAMDGFGGGGEQKKKKRVGSLQAPDSSAAPAPSRAPKPMMRGGLAESERGQQVHMQSAEGSAESSFSFRAARSAAGSARAMTASMAPPRRQFAAPPTTKEYQERDWWANDDPLGSTAQPQRVTVSPFWGDCATLGLRALPGQPPAPFLPPHLTEPTGSFTEVMAALALVALPFASERTPPTIARPTPSSLQITAVMPVVVYHQEQVPARQSEKPLISASATYYDPLDRFVDVSSAAASSSSALSSDAALLDSDSDQQLKLLTEFTAGKTYSCRVVLFNPSPSRVKVRVMQQVPEGAVSVGGGVDVRTRSLHLDAVSSLVSEFSFYFPQLGSFAHQAVQVSSRDVVVGYTEPVVLPVRPVTALAVDAKSWTYLAASGTDAQVLTHLELPGTNVHQLDWTALAWRWRLRKAFWQACIRIARQRLVFEPTLWSYSLHHQDVDALKTMLPGIRELTSAVGLYFASPLLRVDAELAQFDSRYRHLEYRPLIASRAHQLNERPIQNRELNAHWTQFLSYVSFRYCDLSQWTTHHRLQLCYLLLLQERVDDALLHFRDVQRPAYDGSEESIHYDYLRAYLALYSDPQRGPLHRQALSAVRHRQEAEAVRGDRGDHCRDHHQAP